VEHTTLPDVELVVADNGSTDDSMAFVEAQFPAIRTILLEKNHGFAGGYNKALAQVKADYFLLLNSDIEVTEGWLPPLVEFLDNHTDFASVSPVLQDYYKKDHYEYAGAAGGFIDKLGYTFCRGRIFDRSETRLPDDRRPLEVFWTTGACMLIRSNVFREAGGFDDHFFAHMEEVDLCWRLKNMGYRLAVTGESHVYHVGGGTLHKSNPKKTYLNFRNNLFLLYKNLPAETSGRIIATRMVMDYLSVIRFLSHFAFRDITAIFRAHRDFFRGIRQKYRGKIASGKFTPSGNHRQIYRRSVVMDYFLLGNRKFEQLRDFSIVYLDKK